MKWLLALMAAMLLQLSSASCSGTISQYVPAVMGEDGGLVNVTVSLVPGHGGAFATVEPLTAVSTQESIAQAVSYAYELSGKWGCDALVSFMTPERASYVEGPSAGAALAVMTYALLENRTMRQDAIITGTIDEGGGVGGVGGLYEKATGAAQKGAKYFITPTESFYEVLLLRGVEEEYGLKVLQARNVSELIGFMIYNISIAQEGMGTEKRPIPDLQPYDTAGFERFVPVAQGMIGLEQDAMLALNGTDEETAVMRDFFRNEVLRQNRILERGYAFSAANEAFLNYIDISTITAMVSGGVDLPRKKGEAGACLSQIRKPAMTDANFEWVIGADQREGWAYQKLNETETDGRVVSDERYSRYNDLMYAQAWCSVAKGLASAAPEGGRPVDESVWKGMAAEKLALARSVPAGGPDIQFKLDTAAAAYEQGRYGAAIYDALYVITMGDAAGNATLPGENRTSLWGRIYQSQGAFLDAEGEDAGKILAFARALDGATAEMRAALPEDNAPAEAPGGGLLMLAAAFVLTSSLILMFLLLLMLILGRGNHSQGTRTADRAKQKKGRA
ncbi:MAG: hypothetical protein PHV13_03355 [Candidatus ainarchaeum sp.]|nr:hypothetical protein [Candidatus ainarchaeum sp.]